MPGLAEITGSTIGKKLLNGLTGLLLCGFILTHLIGNLLLLVGQEAFNEYAHFLHTVGHGALIPVLEIGLLGLFATHAVSGIQIALARRRARPAGYAQRGNAGGRSHKSVASRSMIVTGSVLALFVIGHVATFRFGAGAPRQYPDVIVDGTASRDLYSLVVDWFNSAPVVVWYVVVMLLLGTHLRHGFWSAFQSLGINNARYMPIIHTVGVAFAALMALGFLAIPVYIYLFVDPVAVGALATG